METMSSTSATSTGVTLISVMIILGITSRIQAVLTLHGEEYPLEIGHGSMAQRLRALRDPAEPR